MDSMVLATTLEESPSECYSANTAPSFARQLLSGKLDSFVETPPITRSFSGSMTGTAVPMSSMSTTATMMSTTTASEPSTTSQFTASIPTLTATHLMAYHHTPVTAMDYQAFLFQQEQQQQLLQLQQMHGPLSSHHHQQQQQQQQPIRHLSKKRKQCDIEADLLQDQQHQHHRRQQQQQQQLLSPQVQARLSASSSQQDLVASTAAIATSNTTSSSSPSSERPKLRKTQHTTPTIRELTSRNIYALFTASSEPVQAKIVSKEPWGVMVEILQVSSELPDVYLNSRYWATWSGSVNAASIPVLDIMYQC